MRLPSDWKAERASGFAELHHLTHTPCGQRATALPIDLADLVLNDADIRAAVHGHKCPRQQPSPAAMQAAEDAIGLFLEYRDQHDYPEPVAKTAALSDIREGLDYAEDVI